MTQEVEECYREIRPHGGNRWGRIPPQATEKRRCSEKGQSSAGNSQGKEMRNFLVDSFLEEAVGAKNRVESLQMKCVLER